MSVPHRRSSSSQVENLNIYSFQSMSCSKIWRRGRLSRSCPYMLCAVAILIALFIDLIILHFSSFESTVVDHVRPTFCSRTLIQKHFMFNQSVKELIEQDPIRAPFTYQIPNGNVCRSDSYNVLLFVISKSSGFHSRHAIRRTWGHLQSISSLPEMSRLHFKLLFFLDIDESSLIRVQKEQNVFQDLIQVNLPQHYHLSTFRDMAILHWTETYCPQAVLTFKTDDDVFVNLFLLANVLNRILSESPKKNSTIFDCRTTDVDDRSALIYGVRIENAPVVRYNHDSTLATSRYIATDQEYPCEYYPNYMSGFGYIINQQARRNLLCAFFRTDHPFHISDVYVTGILPEYLGIRRQNLFLEIRSRMNDDCQSFFSKALAFVCASSSHHLQHSSNDSEHRFELFNQYWALINANPQMYLKRRIPLPLVT